MIPTTYSMKHATGLLSHDLQKSEWRDGTDCQVFVRSLVLPEILVFLENTVESDFYTDEQLEQCLLDPEILCDAEGLPTNSSDKYCTRRLFRKLLNNVQSPPTTALSKELLLCFVAVNDEMSLPVIWHNSVNPGLVH